MVFSILIIASFKRFKGKIKWYACSVTQLCLTLCDLMDYSPPGFFVHGIILARTLDCIATSFSRGSSLTQGLNAHLLRLLHWQVDSLPLSHLGSLKIQWTQIQGQQ